MRLWPSAVNSGALVRRVFGVPGLALWAEACKTGSGDNALDALTRPVTEYFAARKQRRSS